MENSQRFTSNFLWRFLERWGAQGVTFVVSLVLARLLEPSAYGLISLVTVFITILSVFIDSGLGNAIIQKKDATDLDYSTVFFFNIFACSILYLGMFFAAPLIAKFYDKPELTSIVRVLSLLLIISGIKNIQQCYIAKHLLFKKFFFATMFGTIAAAIAGIVMALNGFGVWALVAQMLINATIDTIVIWFSIKWRPKFMFSFKTLKEHFSFGSKLLLSSIIDRIYTELRQLIIGKMYTPADLAFYNKGRQFPSLIVQNINSSIDSVLFPIMAEQQNDPERLKNMTRRAIKVSTFVMMPIMVGLACCATPIIKLILTDKWLPCVPFLRIFCFTFAFYPVHTSNLNAIIAKGRSDIVLKLEIIKKIVGLTALFSTMWFGVMAMAYSLLAVSILSQIINSWPNKKLLGYSYIDQLKDMLPQIAASLIMGVIVLVIGFIPLNSAILLIIQIPVGIIVYVCLSKLFRIDSFDYIINMFKNWFANKFKKKNINENDTVDLYTNNQENIKQTTISEAESESNEQITNQNNKNSVEKQ